MEVDGFRGGLGLYFQESYSGVILRVFQITWVTPRGDGGGGGTRCLSRLCQRSRQRGEREGRGRGPAIEQPQGDFRETGNWLPQHNELSRPAGGKQSGGNGSIVISIQSFDNRGPRVEKEIISCVVLNFGSSD